MRQPHHRNRFEVFLGLLDLRAAVAAGAVAAAAAGVVIVVVVCMDVNEM